MIVDVTAGRRKGVLLAMVLAVSVVLLGSTILNVALPEMSTALKLTNEGQQWVLNAYTLTFAGFLLIAGTLGDRFGLRRTLLVGLAGFVVTTALASLATDVGFVIAMRALMGIFAAAILPTTLAIVLRVFPPRERAGAIVIWSAASGLSISLGPLVGGLMLSAGLWWGSVLLLVALIGVVAFVATAGFLPVLSAAGTGEIRFLPVVLSVGGIGLLVLGVLNGGQSEKWLGATTLAPVLGGLALLALLCVTEGRRANALADIGLFRHSDFAVSVLALSVGSLVLYGAMYFLTFYLQVARGYTPFQTGLLFVPLSLGLLAGAPLSKRLSDRFGSRSTVAAGLFLMTIALAGITLYTMTTAIALLLAVFLVLALGFGLVLSPGMTTAMAAVPSDRVGAGSALVNTSRQIASALGVAVLGSVLWAMYGSRVSPALSALPEEVRAGARQSLSATLAVIHGHEEIVAAQSAFVHALQVTAVVAAAVTLLCAIVVTLSAARSRRRTPAPDLDTSGMQTRPLAEMSGELS